MINWQSVIFNSFWILGLATILAAFSYGYWIADHEGRKLKAQLSGRSFLIPFWAAMILIGVGLAGTSRFAWETIIWIGLTILSLVLLIGLIRK